MAKDLGGGGSATARLGVSGDADAAAEDKDVTHSAEEWCTTIGKRVLVSAPAVHNINTVDESIDTLYS